MHAGVEENLQRAVLAEQIAHLVERALFPVLAQLMRIAHERLHRLARNKGLGMRHHAFAQLGNLDVVLDFRDVKFSSSHLRVLFSVLSVR